MSVMFLGDARAEKDYARYKSAFYESPDYRTLIESEVKAIVVGRRGVGKSALFLRLTDYYKGAGKVEVINFAPEEHEIQAFRPVAHLFDDKFNLVRSATRIAFRYALLMELGSVLATRYKFSHAEGADVVTRHLQAWRAQTGLLVKLRRLVEETVAGVSDAESRIGALAEKFRLGELEDALSSVMESMRHKVVFLVDRLDEGYEPDNTGVAIVDGFLHAAIDLQDKLDGARCVVFLRDNIYRAVENYDQDFSRNLEQSVLRLHWDERGLLNFVANRVRLAGGASAEKSIRVWDSVTRGTLQGEAGFHQCLKMTLFRPRDLLLLLNDAFRIAAAKQCPAIDQDDINSSAKAISEHRLRDLEKEYSSHIPGLGALVKAFAGGAPSFTFSLAQGLVDDVLHIAHADAKVAQQFELFDGAVDAIRSLYSVGFIGIKEEGSSNFVFCHDGRKPDKDFAGGIKLMIHPCYWMALNLRLHESDDDVSASEIYDEYDVTVTSETPEQRNRAIGKLEFELKEIEPGLAGAVAFEKWCLKVIKVLFSGGLRNIELHPNKDNIQRRDVVGTNHGTTPFWRRVVDDYGARQVIFEAKNFADLDRNEFRQILSYLSQDYGNIGFIINRSEDVNLRKDRELAWVRELRNQHSKTVMVLPAKFLVGLLYKVRNPAKHDAGEEALDKLLDTYVRTYFGETAPKRRKPA